LDEGLIGCRSRLGLRFPATFLDHWKTAVGVGVRSHSHSRTACSLRRRSLCAIVGKRQTGSG
jgi:hypothetical protein